MATIRTRKQADGTTRYTAIIRLRRGKALVHQEARTFAHRAAAITWAKHREVALEDPSALVPVKQDATTVAELVRWYIETFQTISKWQRSKQAHLEFLERCALGKLDVYDLTAAILIDHIRTRRAKGAGPATVANDLIWTGVVLRAAKNVKGLPVRPEIVQEARQACAELRLTGKARKRARRPTADELARLCDYFTRRDKRAQIPMLAVMRFALTSARREAEICRLEWKDNDEINQTGMVRDAKHPTAKEGNHRRFKYTPGAWAIVKAQRRDSRYIFPYDPRSVGAAFTRACHFLQIDDLRFHDLRHEATSRLFEMGYQIQEVAQFTLHDSWNELKRYTNLKPENVRAVIAPAPAAASATPRHRRDAPPTTSQPDLFGGQSARRGRSH
jgi:integrase